MKCEKLSDIELPSSLKSLGMCAFQDCTSLTKINITSSIVVLDTLTFAGTGLTEITIPGNVVECGTAFQNCKNLRSAVFSEGMRSILGSFEGCNSLESVIIPASVNRISRSTFIGCENLKDIWIYSDNIELDYVSDVTKRDTHLFADSPNLTIHARRTSNSHIYAVLHNINFAELTVNEIEHESEDVKEAKFEASGKIYSEKELIELLTPVLSDDTDHYWGQFQYALGYGMKDLAYQCLDAYEKYGNIFEKICAGSAKKFLDQTEYKSGVVITFFTNENDDFCDHPTLKAGDIIVEYEGRRIRNADDIYEFSLRSKKDLRTFTVLRPDETGKLQKVSADIKSTDPLIAHMEIEPLTFEAP